MTRFLLGITAAALFSGALAAQPVVGEGGVMNAASYALSDLPNGGIARGSMFIVFGQRLGPATLTQINSFPLNTSLSGTSVRVTVGGTSVDALMIYTSAGQVAAILPSTTPEGNGTLTVTYNGQSSAGVAIRVVRSSFGAFALNQAGSGQSIVQNFVSQAEQPFNALNRPARPGQTLILWGTGLGPATGDERAGAIPGDLPINVEVYVGGKLATVTYKGRSGCCAGIDQIVFTVPEGVEACRVPVAVRTGDVVSNFTTIAVSRTNTCSDPTGLSSNDIERAQTTGNFRQGSVVLARTKTKLAIPGVGTLDMTADTGSAAFYRYDLNKLLASRGSIGDLQPVSLGSCTVYTFKGTDQDEIVDPVAPEALDAGAAITVTGPRGAKQLTKFSTGTYFAQLGGGGIQIPGAPPAAPDFLEPGSYTISNGAGGSAVGPFSVNMTLPPLLNWDNINAVETVNRSQGQQVTWSGGDPAGYTSIFGMSATAKSSAAFFCLERTSVRSFTIPATVLLTLPATSGDDIALLSVSGTSASTPFSATGLDNGQVLAVSGNSKTVSYR